MIASWTTHAAVGGPPAGYASIRAGGVDITAEITDGHLGGLLQVRDRDIPGYSTQLDEIAHAVATEVNALHATGFDLTGAVFVGRIVTVCFDRTIAAIEERVGRWPDIGDGGAKGRHLVCGGADKARPPH